MNDFLRGAIACGCLIVAIFFLSFWWRTKDRLFAIFAAAFLLLGATRVAISLEFDLGEERIMAYVLRLVAYGLILLGIVDKNWGRTAQGAGSVSARS